MPRWKTIKASPRQCAYCTSSFIPVQNHPKYRFCSSTCKSKARKHAPEYKEKLKQYRINKDPEKVKAENRKRYYKHKEYFYAQNAKRRAQIRQTSKLWESEFTRFVLEEAHHLRQLRDTHTQIKWHVDHIIPLRGKVVCGLHIWNNFAVIPKVENLRKGNYHSVHD